MTGDPPIGTEDVFPKEDPAETPEEQQARLRGQTPMQMPGAATSGSVSAQDRADAIVRRESGVTDFSDAADEDSANEYQIEDYPGQDDPSSAAGMRRGDPLNEAPGTTAARGINDFVGSAERLLDGDTDTNTNTDADKRSRR